MAGWFECAAFSLYVYRDQDQPALPDGWSVLFECPSELQYEGYYGMAFIKKNPDGAGGFMYDVAIAHRGTIGSIWDGWSDFLIALGKSPTQFSKGAYLFDEYVRQYMEKTYPIPSPQVNYTVTHTGHSLGAILAELCVASSVRFMESSMPSFGFTFESPGSKQIISDMEVKGQLPVGALMCAKNYVLTALADVDAVNTFNEQVTLQGYSLGAEQIGYDYKSDSTDAGIMPPGITLYTLNYTFHDQHKMAKMYQYWMDSEKYTFIKRNVAQDTPWPIGLENGYLCYLNYDLRQDYWDGYIQHIWDNNPGIHAKYNDDVNQWAQIFKSNLILSKAENSRFRFFSQDAQNPKKLEEASKKEKFSAEENATSWCVIA